MDSLQCDEDVVHPVPSDISVRQLALYALKTQEFNRLSDVATDAILESTHQLMMQSGEHLKAKVSKFVQDSGLNVKDIDGLETLLASKQDVGEVSRSIKQLKNSNERNKYLRIYVQHGGKH